MKKPNGCGTDIKPKGDRRIYNKGCESQQIAVKADEEENRTSKAEIGLIYAQYAVLGRETNVAQCR